MPDQVQSLVGRIREFCKANSDPRVIAKYAKYFREGYDAYGVDGHLLTDEVRRILVEYRDPLGFAGFLDLGDALVENGKYEEACFAIQFVVAFRKEFSRETLDRMARWFNGKVRNWAISDGACGDILSPLLTKSIVGLDDFAPWKSASDKYKRRAVPVAMLGLLKSDFDAPRLLAFVRPMMLDRERVVHQGLGWFLREAWKRRPAEVEQFLLEWKDSAARLIYQYATEKMTPDQKSRFRRAKS